MPVKRRAPKGHRASVSPEAVARWRVVGPGAIDEFGIHDWELACLLLREDALLAQFPETITALREALDRAD